ncbi:MAG TPA: glycoside hydrolase family 2 TIM barrel-domain containing protein, partial [Verrucomicrobiae bacterium]
LTKPNGVGGVSVAEFDDCSAVVPGETLVNGSFEQTVNTPAGPFPTNWVPKFLGNGGAVAVPPAHTGANGLYQYTDPATNFWWTAIYQQRPIATGAAFQASAWIRTPAGANWVAGSQAYFRVVFLSATNDIVLASYQSPIFTTPNTNWTRYELNTEPAPPGAAFVRFTCYLTKPDGSAGQSIVSFDDCSLIEQSIAGARISSRVLGLAAGFNQASFELRNTGNAPLNWQIAASIPWLTVLTNAGVIGPLGSQRIIVRVDRSGLTNTMALRTNFLVTTTVTNIPVDVFMEMPSPPPPAAPAEVKFYGRQLRVRDRLADGTLSEPRHYAIKGAAWAPASMGMDAGSVARRAEFANWYVADIQLLRAMNANTVYTFLDFGTDATAFAVLDNLYKNGLKAIVTVDDDGTANTNRVQQIVTAYKNHPAILAWAVGNEWNINFYHQKFSNIFDSARMTETLAQQVKALDPNHPVAAIFGDIDIPFLNPLRKSDENTNQPVSTERIVNDLCPSVDFWGLNIYRGASFGNVFEQWAAITAKPMFFSEFGTDAYRIFELAFPPYFPDGGEDEPMQAVFNRGLWQEITAHLSALQLAGNCLGGTVFEWNDEWWKVRTDSGGSPDVQENLGFYGGHPDGFANEEWFALAAIDRRLRQTYFNFQADFAAITAPADLDQDGLPDSWEYRIVDASAGDTKTNLVSVLPGDDFDQDGASNYAEYVADTDPASAQSRLRFTGILRSNSVLRLTWTGGANARQYLERAASLSAGATWVRLRTNLPPTAITNTYNDAIPTGGTNGFYRLRVTR